MIKKYTMTSFENNFFEFVATKIQKSFILSTKLKINFELKKLKDSYNLILHYEEPVERNDQIVLRRFQRKIEKKMNNFSLFL